MFKLKDDKRQRALEEALPGFADKLQAACAKWYNMTLSGYINVSDERSNGGRKVVDWYVKINREDLIQEPAYNPNDWNRYDVVPPEDVWMRAEYYASFGKVRCAAVYRNGSWWTSDTEELRGHLSNIASFKYRPWV